MGPRGGGPHLIDPIWPRTASLPLPMKSKLPQRALCWPTKASATLRCTRDAWFEFPAPAGEGGGSIFPIGMGNTLGEQWQLHHLPVACLVSSGNAHQCPWIGMWASHLVKGLRSKNIFRLCGPYVVCCSRSSPPCRAEAVKGHV